MLPQPSCQFIVEVDASDVGIGAILSQRSEEDQQIHPVAFLSRRFSPAEANYDVGNRELLAVHAALTEWRYWLEGAQHPILIWTDHRLPAGLLRPLPIPGQPWSDVALDFVTGLPTSRGNTTILTLVDRFSKMVHFVALPKLPSAAETADLLVRHVVRLHGFPKTSFLTVGPSSPPGSGEPSARALGPRSTYRRDTIPRPMGRQSGLIRLWRRHFAVSPPVTPPPRACTFPGLSTPLIPW